MTTIEKSPSLKPIPGTAGVFAVRSRESRPYEKFVFGLRREFDLTHRPSGAVVDTFRRRVDAVDFAAELFVKLPKESWLQTDLESIQHSVKPLEKWINGRVREINLARGDT